METLSGDGYFRTQAEFSSVGEAGAGVDTGLVHLAAALGRPTLALFSASDPALTGVLARTPAFNLGRGGPPPTLAKVMAVAAPLL